MTLYYMSLLHITISYEAGSNETGRIVRAWFSAPFGGISQNGRKWLTCLDNDVLHRSPLGPSICLSSHRSDVIAFCGNGNDRHDSGETTTAGTACYGQIHGYTILLVYHSQWWKIITCRDIVIISHTLHTSSTYWWCQRSLTLPSQCGATAGLRIERSSARNQLVPSSFSLGKDIYRHC